MSAGDNDPDDLPILEGLNISVHRLQRRGFRGAAVRGAAIRIAFLASVMAGCNTAGTGPETPAPSLQPPRPSAAEATTGPGRTADRTAPDQATSSAGPVLVQSWAIATLTDVRTGDEVRIADLVASGRVVFLEPMAIWCTRCRAQQREAVAAFERLDRARVAWVGIDVETAEDADQLARYSDQNGFDFTYVIADRDMSRALAAEFGDIVLNPPATNVIVIGTDGRVTHSTGHRSADELVELATSNGGG